MWYDTSTALISRNTPSPQDSAAISTPTCIFRTTWPYQDLLSFPFEDKPCHVNSCLQCKTQLEGFEAGIPFPEEFPSSGRLESKHVTFPRRVEPCQTLARKEVPQVTTVLEHSKGRAFLEQSSHVKPGSSALKDPE